MSATKTSQGALRVTPPGTPTAAEDAGGSFYSSVADDDGSGLETLSFFAQHLGWIPETDGDGDLVVRELAGDVVEGEFGISEPVGSEVIAADVHLDGLGALDTHHEVEVGVVGRRWRRSDPPITARPEERSRRRGARYRAVSTDRRAGHRCWSVSRSGHCC